MSQQYNSHISRHYAAYRPPLHQMILNKLIPLNSHFKQGLDVGCGTGVSTLALTPYCERILAIDPSADMIAQTQAIKGVEYRVATAQECSLEEHKADVVTFAGSLFYAQSESLCIALKRLCQPDAKVLVYDFEVHLDALLQRFDIHTPPSEGGYDHQVNFDNHGIFAPLQQGQETLSIAVSHQQIAHVLLASESRYQLLRDAFHLSDPFQAVVERLITCEAPQTLTADIFYSCYTFSQR
ncbi:class I SAM-dependent DNA methyltransferase [Motilimonas pumila]|nr:class I SAM-dependent methyltransferase [Motilimonas pumila]